MEISRVCRTTCGIILIGIPTIEYGGSFLLRSLTDPSYYGNPLRQNLFRAGHAHAGVIVILALVCELLLEVARLPRIALWFSRVSLPLSAILVSAGFFLSATQPDVVRPGNAIYLVLAGEIILGGAVVITGIGLLRGAGRVLEVNVTVPSERSAGSLPS